MFILEALNILLLFLLFLSVPLVIEVVELALPHLQIWVADFFSVNKEN